MNLKREAACVAKFFGAIFTLGFVFLLIILTFAAPTIIFLKLFGIIRN